MKDVYRLHDLAARFDSGTAVTRKHASTIRKAIQAAEDGQQDEGLVFELDIVEAFLAASNRREEVAVIHHLAEAIGSDNQKPMPLPGISVLGESDKA